MNLNPEFHCYALAARQALDDKTPGTLSFDERFDYADIDTDSDFECKRLTAFQSDGGEGPGGAGDTEATRQIVSLLFNIRDNATGRTLFSGFANSAELFGDGRVPFVLPTSHFFKRGGRAQVIYPSGLQQGSSFGNAQVWLIMVGAKHFKEAR